MNLNTLIVDDAPVIQMTMRKMLVREGIAEERVRVAGDAAEALTQFREQRPNVVFMDIQLGDASGEKLAAEMLTQRPDAKVVIISSLHRDDERVAELISAGAFDVLRKPIHQDALASLLHRIEQDAAGAGRIR